MNQSVEDDRKYKSSSQESFREKKKFMKKNYLYAFTNKKYGVGKIFLIFLKEIILGKSWPNGKRVDSSQVSGLAGIVGGGSE